MLPVVMVVAECFVSAVSVERSLGLTAAVTAGFAEWRKILLSL